MTRSQWGAAVALSVAVHLAVAGLYGLTPEPESVALGGGELGDGMEIGLDPGVPDGDPTVTATEDTPLEPAAPPPPPPPPPPKPEPMAEKVPKPVAEPEIAAVAAPAASENLVAVTEETAPEPASDTPQDTPAESTHMPVPAASQQASADARPLPRGSSQVYGKRHPGGGKARNTNQYFGQVMAWMNKHKHYPTELKKKKQEGVVEIQFTLGRDGELLEASIAKSCGIEALDQAALQMMADAAPLPPMPDFIPQDTLTLVIPVEYSLITNAVN